MEISFLNVTISNKLCYCELSYILISVIFQSSSFLGHGYLVTGVKPSGSLIILKISHIAMEPKTLLMTLIILLPTLAILIKSDMDK